MYLREREWVHVKNRTEMTTEPNDSQSKVDVVQISYAIQCSITTERTKLDTSKHIKVPPEHNYLKGILGQGSLPTVVRGQGSVAAWRPAMRGTRR